MMWTRHIVMALLAFCSGTAISAGTFAFLLVIGVIPRILGKTKEVRHIFLAENTIILGLLVGNILSIIEWDARLPVPWLVHTLFAVYGISSGIFVGCISVALAEILNTFPILFRRLYIKRGLGWVMVAMAFGKMAGSLFYFLGGYGLPEYW